MFLDRRFPAAVLGAPLHHWDPALLPGAGSWADHPPGQHRGLEIHQPPLGGHRLCKLCGECPAEGGGKMGFVLYRSSGQQQPHGKMLGLQLLND